ncbi:AAA family ATPase [Promicromonospora sp. NFX87]|uniref:AAA family ATPase n=1 Tax=Promicromonospora sp. NFX87 TaxID=3402691 RepID=UPI003AFA242E
MSTTPALNRTTDPLLTVIAAAGRVGVPVLLWGHPGTGKSSLLSAVAAAEGLPMETVIASVREPSDFAGLPVVADDGTVTMAPPSWARRLADAEDGGFLFLDELSTAPPAVQAATLRVTLDRVVGDLPLGKKVRVIAAANPPESAADGWDLPAPQANRFLHINHTLDTEAWCSGLITGFPTPTMGRVYDPTRERLAASRGQVSAFIHHHGDLLHRMPPTTDASATGRAWPSPRTWTMLADVLAVLDAHDTPAALLAASGLVGTGPATEFLNWRENNDLPDPADVIDDPTTTNWSALRPDQAYALLSSVVATATAPGTKAGWLRAWPVLAHANDNGKADIAVNAALSLLRARPAGTMPPTSVKAFTRVLDAAGLLNG